jgi:replicative DNA helicase
MNTTKPTNQLPQSVESEKMVLGCMLTRPDALNRCCAFLQSPDFYNPHHQTIFQTLYGFYSQDKLVDIHLVCEELKRTGKLAEIGGVGYVTHLSEYIGTSVYVDEYSENVKNKSLLRQLITTAQQAQQESLKQPEDVHSLIDEVQHSFYKLSQSDNKKLGVTLEEFIAGNSAEETKPFLKQLEEKQEYFLKFGKPKLDEMGLPTHFTDLDDLIHGLQPSHLVILACRPAMGKTGLSLNIAENICMRSNVPVGFFSLEMTADQIATRFISSHSEVENSKLNTGEITGHEYQSVVKSIEALKKSKFIIDDTPSLKITDIKARARRMKEAYGIRLLIIDYLQLIAGSGTVRSMESRQNEISEISRMLKNLARELNIPILCCSQLSRKVEERQNHRPMLSDIRESGSIEQDADIVLFLLRHDYYDPYDKPGLAEVIVAKNRHGSVGTVPLTFRKELVKFSNCAKEALEQEENNIY